MTSASGMLSPMGCLQWQPRQVALLVFWVAMEMVRVCNASVNRTYSNHVSPCPSQCNCSDNEVDCRGLNLSAVPLSLPLLIASLRMSNNKMRRVNNNSMSELHEMRKLYLDHNHISVVEDGAFRSLVRLEVLHLQGNNLVSLHRGVFAGLYHLRHLYLHSNALSSLHPQLLSDLPHLHILDLRANRLTSFPRSPFHNLRQLSQLNLAQNPFRGVMRELLFTDLEQLRELDLGETGLSSIHPELLLPLTELNRLNLARNRLKNFNVNAVRTLHNLQYLNFSGNPFRCDCKIKPLYEWITNQVRLEWDEYSSPRCHTPHGLRGLVVYVLVANNFTCPKRAPKRQTHFITRFRKPPNVVNPAPLPYDRMMGWYTAATLSGMLVLFLIGVALDKAKRHFFRWRRLKREERECLENQPTVEMKNCKPKLIPTNSINSGREVPVADNLNFMSRQSSCEGPANLKRNDLGSSMMQPRTPLPKVEIHLAPNLHDLTNFHNPQDYLKSQDILIDVSDSIEKNDSMFLLWPAKGAKLNKLQKQVETSL